MNRFEGICIHCGARYLGQALSGQRSQLCVRCGHALEVRRDGVTIRSGWSPFKAEEYKLDSEQDNWTELRDKNILYYLTRN